jgi:hypothetical protein
MSVRKIQFLSDVNVEGTVYTTDQIEELPFLEASLYIRYGWARDFYSGQSNTPVMHVFLQPHDKVISLGEM